MFDTRWIPNYQNTNMSLELDGCFLKPVGSRICNALKTLC